MKEKIYQYILYFVVGCALAFSAFLLISDNVAPFTTQATLYKPVANIAPEVSGVITHVNVENGENVQQGQVLFTIDPKPYQIAVAQAEAELKQAQDSNLAMWQQLASAKEGLTQKNSQWHNALNTLHRYQALNKKGLTTRQELDNAQTAEQVAKSAIAAAKAEVLRIKAQLAGDKNSAAVELALAKLQQAELNLTHTKVVAQTSGTISNLQIETGTYVGSGTPVLFLVNNNDSWLSADFNEKGISHLQPNTQVSISFDALPGQVFTGVIENKDDAIYDANNPETRLSTVANDTRWIREQQKIRTRIDVQQLDTNLISGARASVVVKNGNPIIDAISRIWIHCVALFRYVY
ncbi:HlyD family secretion protein [Photobacterium damselae subsp. damselae]